MKEKVEEARTKDNETTMKDNLQVYYINESEHLKELIDNLKHMNHQINLNIKWMQHLHLHLLNTFVKCMAYLIMLLILTKNIF